MSSKDKVFGEFVREGVRYVYNRIDTGLWRAEADGSLTPVHRASDNTAEENIALNRADGLRGNLRNLRNSRAAK